MTRPRVAALAVLTAVLLPAACAGGLLDDTDTGATLTVPPVATVSIDPTPPATVHAANKIGPVRPSKTIRPTRRTTTTTVPPPPASARCGDWWDEARAAGWSQTDLPFLDYVMWRESRCTPTAHNPRPPDDSYGLVQLNMRAHRSWVGPIVGWDFNRLFDPTTNLRVARRLFDMAADTYGCGWQPWRSSGWTPC